MSTTLNSAEVLRAIVSNPDAFPDAKAEIEKAALAIVSAQLKARSIDLDKLSTVAKVLGLDTLGLVLESLPDKTVATLTKKIDPHHPEAKNASAIWQRKHLCALAAGDAKPSEKPERKAGPKKATTGKTGGAKRKSGAAFNEENFWPTSMSAVGSRKQR